MLQAPQIVDQMILKEMAAAINAALLKYAISGAGTNEPLGILNTPDIPTVAIGTNGGALTNTHLAELEEKLGLNEADQGKLTFICNPKTRRKLKVTSLDSGSGQMVWSPNSRDLMGYPTICTKDCPSDLDKGEGSNLSALILGDLSSLSVLQFGGLGITINPFTAYESVSFHVNAYFDVLVNRAGAFGAIVDIATT
jgi:HK97 family phage major capsid protein